MSRRWSRSARTRGEDGSVLILGIVIVIGVILILVSTLSFADAGVRTSVGYRTHRNVTYYTDGAMAGAINSIRGSASLGSWGVPCPSFTPPAPTLPSNVGATTHTYRVDCTPLPGSGAIPKNQPRYAIQMLGTGNGEGINLAGTDRLQVDGSVYDNNYLSYAPSNYLKLFVNGDIDADGCTYTGPPHLVVRGLRKCNETVSSTDPGYPPEVNLFQPVMPQLQNVDPPATCQSGGTVVVFQPGLYTEPPAPPQGCGSGNRTVMWFQPGKYYFDFQPSPSTKGFTGQWSLGNNVDIVGGTLANGWDAGTPAATVDAGLPGACVPPNSSPPSAGVQFIFGGPSALTIKPSDKVELCADTFTDSQEIVLYALKSGSRTSHPNTPLKPTVVSPSSSFVPQPPAASLSDALGDIDGKVATGCIGKCDKGGQVSQVMAATIGYTPIPSGAQVNSLKVAIAHQESDPNLTVSGSIFLGGNPYVINGLSNCSSLCTQVADITPDLVTDPAYKALDGTFAPPVGMTFTVGGSLSKGAKSATVTLDGMNLIADYTDPGFEVSSPLDAKGSPCAAVNCPLLANNPQGSSQGYFFHGTVYAPVSGLNVTVQSGGTTIFDRGLIAQTVVINVSASSKQLTAPFSVPQATITRQALFTAYVDGVPRLRAVATYQDWCPIPFGSGKVAVPGYAVTVSNWSVLR